jgi:hypothetical protein
MNTRDRAIDAAAGAREFHPHGLPVASRPVLRPRLTPGLGLLVFALAAAPGCGGSSAPQRPAPAAAEFPSAKGKTITEVVEGSGAKQAKLVIAPAAQAFEVGPNRYPFGVFTVANEQISDAGAALYFARDEHSPVQGPLPAQVSSLETKPAYRAQGTEGPGEAKTVYVVPQVNFDQAGPWLAIAMLKGPNGLEVSRVPSPVVLRGSSVPNVGDRPPAIHTPTSASVGGDLSKIDTRVPPDQMHEVDFADALGKKPTVLVFATPALCQSRVCGPVVDIVQQVADEYKGRADFIHMEVYNDNNASEGVRPQLDAFDLQTEPWTFLIDSDGVIRDRIEGAYGVFELEHAMKSIVPG